jgi:hypothetical protein
VGRKKDWEKEQAKERAKNKKRKAEGKSVMPEREDWSPKDHGLTALLQQRPLAAGQKIHIVDESEAHVIDLLDPLGF